jgi:hypothetical protein
MVEQPEVRGRRGVARRGSKGRAYKEETRGKVAPGVGRRGMRGQRVDFGRVPIWPDLLIEASGAW